LITRLALVRAVPPLKNRMRGPSSGVFR